MSEQIEPGDLIRRDDGSISVAKFHRPNSNRQIIAKGPGWTRHDGSSVNPVPGAVCEIFGSAEAVVSPEQSEVWVWPKIKFYRVTKAAPSQPPAPQPGWVATVELRFFENQGGMAGITFPSGWTHYVDPRTIDKLDWSPPPPPPWEPEIGKPAYLFGENHVVRGIYNGFAWAENVDGDMYSAPISDISPPKGGA